MFCGVLPAITVFVLFASAVGDDAVAFDFRPFHAAAEAILRGESPYPGPTDPLTAAAGPYVYPPFPALLAIPLTSLSVDVAGLLVMAVLVAAALAVPFTLGVRDWRCYGLALLWPPVISAIQTGNMTLLLALAAALAWRFRERRRESLGVRGRHTRSKVLPLAARPLVRSDTPSRHSALVGRSRRCSLLASWAVIGFAGLSSYPDLLRRLEDTVGSDSYTAYIVGLDLGLSPGVARGLWLFIGAALLVSCVVVARRVDERSGFILALAAALALTPIVWLHYFALLLVVVALAQPRLGVSCGSSRLRW